MLQSLYILRDGLAQQAINGGVQAHAVGIPESFDVLRRPYDDQPGRERVPQRRPAWACNRAGYSMRLCSSQTRVAHVRGPV